MSSSTALQPVVTLSVAYQAVTVAPARGASMALQPIVTIPNTTQTVTPAIAN